MTARPHILYLTHRVPYPPNRGDRIRSYHTLRFLAERANVHLACLTEEPLADEALAKLNELCAQVSVVRLNAARWLRGAWSLATGGSATEGLFRSSELHRVVREWAERIPFDAVLVFCSSMYQFVPSQLSASTRVVVDLVDVDSQKWFDYARESRGWKRLLHQTEGRRVRALESRIVSEADAVALVSPQEAALFREVVGGGEQVHGVINGVDVEYFQPDVSPRENKHECVFVGVLDYRANVEGLKWFCSEVWPAVREQIPDATFRIVGRRPNEAVKRLDQQAGVEVVGEVPDVREHLRRAAVVVAPLKVARGVQNKVLEAMAMGKRVVASPQALEGLELERGVDALEADLPNEWSTNLVELFSNSQGNDSLRRAARRYVEQRHAWSTCLAPLDSLTIQSDHHLGEAVAPQ